MSLFALLITGVYFYFGFYPRQHSFSSPTGQTILSPTSTSDSISMAGWVSYKDEEYKFQFHYPKEGWGLTSRITEPHLSYPLQKEAVNLYTERSPGPVSVIITIGVYKKPSTYSLLEWLSKGYDQKDLSKVREIEIGDIETALAKAYTGKTGILTYKEFKKDDVIGYKIGAVLLPDELSYTTYFMRATADFNVYAIDIHLPFYVRETPYEPDSIFLDTYNKIVSTFKFGN